MNENYWLFNTDETEQEGEGAYREMIAQSRIAAWGHCRGTGARGTLNRPDEGETVFFFRAGHGLIPSRVPPTTCRSTPVPPRAGTSRRRTQARQARQRRSHHGVAGMGTHVAGLSRWLCAAKCSSKGRRTGSTRP